jgi:60 kDa SS-A/Ro ribonucleoprotein
MVQNNAGGFTFKLDDWEQLNRFLILGSEAGTYYVGQAALTELNAQAAIRCIQSDGTRAVKAAHRVNIAGRAPKVDSQLFVMALALKHGNSETKAAVEHSMPSMLRTGSHLLQFVSYLNVLGGWNRTKRRIVSDWFHNANRDVPFQMLKYRDRYTWHMRDVLRVAHVKPSTHTMSQGLRWFVGKEDVARSLLPECVQSFIHMNTLVSTAGAVDAAMTGIELGLPREVLPTEALADVRVLSVLLQSMPYIATLRNLARMASRGAINEATRSILIDRLTDHKAIGKSRVHPFNILLALLTYEQRRSGGHNIGRTRIQSWQTDQGIMDSLEIAFELATANAQPTDKRILFATDVSGSMRDTYCVGTQVTAAKAAGAVMLSMARNEPNARCIQFATAGYGGYGLRRGGALYGFSGPMVQSDQVTSVIQELDMRRIHRIEDIPQDLSGGTDLAAPVIWALQQRIPFDAFVILTDNETWAGHHHPAVALNDYRATVNPMAKMVCASMAANHANIVDPTDPLSLGCAGLDGNLAAIIRGFLEDAEPGVIAGDSDDESE